MATRIKHQLRNKIITNEWLDDKTKTLLTQKVTQIENIIGSSDAAYYDKFDEVVEMDGVFYKLTKHKILLKFITV